MKKHTKIYLDHFGYGVDSFIPCEVCSKRAVDIHHIVARGIGSGKGKDEIQNLMALCRECHVEFGDKKHHMDFLMSKHAARL
jgi:5-methylcytosine-specific restriction endonuclease McrA